MDVQHLINQLHDTNPQKRIAALRVLAMVEETRALNAIGVTFKNDPDEQVREVAQWAGRLIWQAQQRGHSTEQAIEAHFGRPRQDVVEEMIVSDLLEDTPDTPDAKIRLDTLRTQWAHLDALPREQADPPRKAQILPDGITEEDMALLDVGLSESF